MLQTLLNLLHLYNLDETSAVTADGTPDGIDLKDNWVELIESNPGVLCTIVSTREVKILEDWHLQFSGEELKLLVLAFSNQQAHQQSNQRANQAANFTEQENQATALICEQLAVHLEATNPRKALLTGQLIGTGYEAHEPLVSDALRFCTRDPGDLLDSDLFTRLVAVACQCATNSTSLDEGARLLEIDVTTLTELIGKSEHKAASFASETTELTTELTADLKVEFDQALSLANTKASFARLLQEASQQTTIAALAYTVLDVSNIRIFQAGDEFWTDGEFRLKAENSIIASAAIGGTILSSLAHPGTAIDEKILESMNASQGLAIPVGEDLDVVLVGLNKDKLLQLSNQLDRMAQFRELVGHSIAAARPRTQFIEIDEVHRSAREIIHEAGNPLSTVQNYLKVLSLKVGSEHDAQQTLTTISDELFRVSDIIKRFSSVGVEIDKVRAFSKTNPVLTSLIDLYSKSNEHIRFVHSLDPAGPVAWISSSDFKQIITNLIKNAVEACNHGDMITIETAGNVWQSGAPFVEINVRDTGPGIDKDLETELFAAGATTKTGDHAGTGLAVVKALLQANGATISHRTVSDQNSDSGTQFRITIPQKIEATGGHS
jgi:signal transduction histidine kinase